jgi:hypothetical protein
MILNRSRAFCWILIVGGAAITSAASAQLDATGAGIITKSDEIKPWPEYDCSGSGFSNVDMSVGGGR